MVKILTVVGNRPQFVKLGVTARRLRDMGDDAPFHSVVVNTGQHYDTMLSDVFFSELEIEAPKYNLGMGSGHIVDQIGRMLAPLREIIEQESPDGVLVYGDTNSTVAAGIVAGHLGVPLIHVEGGERLYRRAAMPEEINRVVTDHLADLCLASSRKAVRYLEREGFGPERARFVGDPMYDIFKMTGVALAAREARQPGDYGLEPGRFVLSTMHRAENTDSRELALGLLQALDESPLPVLLPAHPRLRNRLEGWGWAPRDALRLVEPLGYFDFQSLLRQCLLTVSDSGGVNRESFFAGKGCIVPLDSSAWVEAVEAGFALTVGNDAGRLRDALHAFRPSGDVAAIVEHEFGAGDAGARIVDQVADYIDARKQRNEGPWHALGHYDDLPKPHEYTGLSLASFAGRLDALKSAGFAFALPDGGAQQGASCSLLHVVDRDPSAAARLARIEADAGAVGTFFVPVSADAYNPFAVDASAAIAEILGLGHALGLLFQPGGGQQEARLAREIGLLEGWFGAKVAAVMPTAPGASLDAPVPVVDASRPAGLAVATEFDDPAGLLSPGAAAYADRNCAFIVHPALWAEIPSAPLEQELRLLDNRRRRGLERLRSLLPAFRRWAQPGGAASGERE